MKNQIILYNNQTVDSFIYSSTFLTESETDNFENNENLSWKDYSNAKIICNFSGNLTSTYYEGKITQQIIGYEIFKKRPQEKYLTKVGNFNLEDLGEEGENYYIIDYNVKNNNEYFYFISPVAENNVQFTFSNKVLTNWDVFSLVPIYQIDENRYGIVKDEFGQPINWIFQLNCVEDEIVLNQDKTVFTNFSNKPKISIGDLNYYTGNFSCLLGNTLYNDTYYEPNTLLEKWDKMIKENHIYLFKNPKGDSMIISLENNSSKKYMNEVANYYIDSYNNNQFVTNRPTTISFSYTEVLDSDKIQICGV